MQHIVVNNYTNAGLSILFLLVVYAIIFYGIKTALAARKTRSAATRKPLTCRCRNRQRPTLRARSKFHPSINGNLPA